MRVNVTPSAQASRLPWGAKVREAADISARDLTCAPGPGRVVAEPMKLSHG